MGDVNGPHSSPRLPLVRWSLMAALAVCGTQQAQGAPPSWSLVVVPPRPGAATRGAAVELVGASGPDVAVPWVDPEGPCVTEVRSASGASAPPSSRAVDGNRPLIDRATLAPGERWLEPIDLQDWATVAADSGTWWLTVRCTLDGVEGASKPAPWVPGSDPTPAAAPADLVVGVTWQAVGDTLEGVVRIANSGATPVLVPAPAHVDLDGCAGSPWRVAGAARACTPTWIDTPSVVLEPGARLAARVVAHGPLPGPSIVYAP